MKKVIIDGKEYYQQEQADIDTLPKMNIDKDILTKYKWDGVLEQIKKENNSE